MKKKNNLVWVYINIIAIGIIAFIIMIWITPYGVGISADSTTYIGGAKSILSGKGLSINGSPLTHYPPFYPILLAFAGIFENNLVQASRFLNAILFSINAGMIVLVVYSATKRSFVASICAALFFLCSSQLLEVHAWAWSEPLFITCSLCGIALLYKYVLRPTMPLLILSSLFFAFALLTRYVGLAFLPPAIVMVLLGGRDKNIWQKCRAAFIWFMFAVAPLGIWLIRNLLISGTAANRKLIYHPVSVYQYCKSFASVLFNFFIPVTLPKGAGIAVLIFWLFATSIVIILIVYLFKQHHELINWHKPEIAIILSCLLCISSYMLFLYISVSFFDAQTPIDFRILSPVLAFLLLVLFSAAWAILQIAREPVVHWGILVLIILSISIKAFDAIHSALNIRGNGLGYTARQWHDSESVAFVKSISSDVNIYSNGADAIGFLTGKNVLSIPAKTDPGTALDNPNFKEQIQSVCENIIENRAILVYLDNFRWRGFFPTQAEIKRDCRLPVLERLNDGTVYGKK
jgi:hypothetical protein